MRLKSVKAFIIRDLKSSFREKEVVFWIFVWPLIWVFMVAYVFLPPSAGEPVTVKLGVVNYDESQAPFNGTAFIDLLQKIEYNGTKLFDITIYKNEDDMIQDLRKGCIDAGIVIPNGFGENLTTSQAKIRIYIGARNPYSSQINIAILSQFLEEFNEETSLIKINQTLGYIPENETITIWNNETVPLREFLRSYLIGIAKPVNATTKEVKPEALATREAIVGWYTIGAVGMLFLYGGFNFGALLVIEEKERGTLKRVLSTPASPSELLVGRTISSLAILGLAAVVAILTGAYLCKAKILWSPFNPLHWLVPVLVVVTALMTIGLGMIISLAARTTKGASSLSTILGLLLAFTAGVWFPKEWMPQPLRYLADYFPVTWGIDIIRSIMVFEASFTDIQISLVKVLIAAAVIYMIGILAYKKLIRWYAER